jgi:predicted ABC-type ATPase
VTPDKTILIIAGPNGAGKTTFAREFLLNEANCPTFVNADLIAAGLNPLQPEQEAMAAGRMMLNMIDDYVSRGRSFAFETTLSGRGYARMIPRWQEQGYRVRLYFLTLPGADFAVNRVRQRVAEGGHHVPEEVIRRRMEKGWRNFQEIYVSIVDEWVLYDGTANTPVVVERGSNPRLPGDQQMTVKDPSLIYATEEQKKTLTQAELGLIALKRAAIKARRRAIATQGYVATWRNGKMYRDTKV